MIDPTDPASKQYQGWPRTINQLDNYSRKAVAWLPEIKVEGISDAVVHIINDKSKETVYSIRIKGNSFKPKVFATGKYSIKVGEPESGQWKSKNGVKALKEMIALAMEENSKES